MQKEGKIEITGVDLVKFVQAVYDLSAPVGMGFLSFKPGPLPEAQAKEIVDRQATMRGSSLSLDYVAGRGCKMHVRRDDEGRLWIDERWYDHSSDQLKELLTRVGVAIPTNLPTYAGLRPGD